MTPLDKIAERLKPEALERLLLVERLLKVKTNEQQDWVVPFVGETLELKIDGRKLAVASFTTSYPASGPSQLGIMMTDGQAYAITDFKPRNT